MSETFSLILAEDITQQDSRPVPWICKFDGNRYDTKNFFSVHWNMPTPRQEDGNQVGHPPHMHKETEIMMLIGMDPENPYDLGAEVEFCIGEDMKKHIFTRTCTIVIPANTPHGFYRVVEAKCPWMFVQIQEASPRTEKFLWEYLTEEQISGMTNRDFWQDVGYDD